MASNALTREDLEALFGSDEAMGIVFVNDDGEVIPNTPDTDGRSVFPDGSSATNCTNYAEQIKQSLDGHDVQIVGFANESNPNCDVVREEWHPGGHDFAIVDYRWLVDPWARLVACVRDRIVYDLQDPKEARMVAELYGDPERWSFSGTSSIGHRDRFLDCDRRGLQRVSLCLEQESEMEMETNEKQVLIANVVQEDLGTWGSAVQPYVEGISAQYLYDKDQKVPGGAEYAGCEVVFREGVDEIRREKVLEHIEGSLSEPANIDAMSSRIYSGGRIVSVASVADEDDRQRHFEETLDHLRGNPIITRTDMVRARGGDRALPSQDTYGEVTAIFPAQDGHSTLVGVQIGDGEGYVHQTPRDRRSVDAPQLGDTVHMIRVDPRHQIPGWPYYGQEPRLEKVDLDSMERFPDAPGKFNVTPLGVMEDRAVVRHAGRDKVLDLSGREEAAQTLRQYLHRPVELHAGRDASLSVRVPEVQKGRGPKRDFA